MCGQRFIKIVCLPFLSFEPYCLTAYTICRLNIFIITVANYYAAFVVCPSCFYAQSSYLRIGFTYAYYGTFDDVIEVTDQFVFI